MALMRRISQSLGVLLVVAFSAWLFLYDDAAQPGPLSFFHEDIQDCTACHEPWRGASDKQCLECHDFDDSPMLKKEIRFHEARQNCMACHKEHQMLGANISIMDHKPLNEELLCTTCHFDRHDGLFGRNCRECHGIRSWKVPGYRHPVEDRTDCYRCHKGPQSHYDERFWDLIVKDMEKESVPERDCCQCHTIYHWRYRRMEHEIPTS